MWLHALLLLTACKEEVPSYPLFEDLDVGTFLVSNTRSGLTVSHGVHGTLLRDLRIASGSGDAHTEMTFGAFRFTDEQVDLRDQSLIELGQHQGSSLRLTVVDRRDEVLGELLLTSDDSAQLTVDWDAAGPDEGPLGRLEISFACEPDESVLGLGSHAMDVDHVGQAFPLWVSEPGIGKSTDEDEPADWPLRGTRHASSYPVPWLLRPRSHMGLLVDTGARVDVDLCATSDRIAMQVWEDDPTLALIAGDRPLDILDTLGGIVGRPPLAPPWAFAPWNDAIRGPERVREVAATLRAAGAPSSVIWTEDWKGAQELATGYRLGEEWQVDRDLYPDVEDLDAELEALGFKWFAYFAPFVSLDSDTGRDAAAADVLIHDQDGEIYWFTGVTFEPVTLVDLSDTPGRDWARDRLTSCRDLGFDGWMVDYAEWLPTDAVLASGQDARLVHNRYPEQWQSLNNEVFDGRDGTTFCRSGWHGTQDDCPIVWVGDQRTSFDTDDGFATVIPLSLGLSASGVPITTHDVAGYQSVGNAPSTKELWFRWAALGAFSPVLRTHHGSFDTENWQFDTDTETLDHWVAMATEHMRLWPYRYGLARLASEHSTPMVLPTSFLFDGEDPNRMDAWMLGEALLVAPVLEEGMDHRNVDLPEGDWFDWWTLAPATSGTVEAPWTHIPVFARSGTVVPTFDTVPDTLTGGADADLVDLDEADAARVLTVFGTGGRFTEADGTTYAVDGTASSGETTATLTDGTIAVGGLTVTVTGAPRERSYRVVTTGG